MTNIMQPCPKCLSENYDVGENNGKYFVHCLSCKYHGPEEESLIDAIYSWNKDNPGGKLKEDFIKMCNKLNSQEYQTLIVLEQLVENADRNKIKNIVEAGKLLRKEQMSGKGPECDDIKHPEILSQDQVDALLRMPDNPANPSHYSRWKIEPIDFAIANNLDFIRGNIIKYIMRYDAKGGLEDLKKARDYLNRLIVKTEKEAKND